MLHILHIENIAVIEQAEICFDPGFNVLTGETGAGKSIVIDAISAILGERTSRELVRTGAERANVSAIFTSVPKLSWFEDNQIEYNEEEILVQRQISSDGKNQCRVNGRPVTVATLRQLGQQLISIHGQHDSQQLFDEENHLTYLDQFAKDSDLLQSYQEQYQAVQEIRSQIRGLSMDEAEKLRLVETLQYQIAEIEKAELNAAEEDELNERRKILQNSEKLEQALYGAIGCVYGDDSSDGAAGLLGNAEHLLSRVSGVSDQMEALFGKLQEVRYAANDVAEELMELRDSIQYSEQELENIEQRLDLIHKLKRKYGADIPAILDFLERSKARLDEIEFAGDRLDQLKKQLSQQEQELSLRGEALRKVRKDAAGELEKQILRELAQLDMPKLQFVCQFTQQMPQENGMDLVQFFMSANVGEALRPMSKVASGGELARIMLAMKNVLSRQDHIDTMIFDEVDAGVSGRAAQKVAQKLWSVSCGKQVLCVTHLPQIAAMADTHFTVEKQVRNGRTYTEVLKLDASGCAEELSRLIGGAVITETTLAGAQELLASAKNTKKELGNMPDLC